IGAMESSIGISNPSRRTRIEFSRRGTICFPLSVGLGMTSRLVVSRMRNTSVMGRPAASCHDQPVNFAATRFRNVAFPYGAVLVTSSVLHVQRVFQNRPLDGIPHHPKQPTRGAIIVDLAFDEIVLRSFLQR